MTIACFLIFILAVLVSVLTGTTLVWAMGLGSLLFFLLGRKKGVPAKELLTLMAGGIRGAAPAFTIFLLVGVLTAAWRASGTIAYFVYWGIRLIRPELYLFCTFLALSAASMLMGSSFGASGTLGVMLLVLAKSGGVPLILAGGAILAGAMVGDRGSPMSGSANLVAAVTGTELLGNIRGMLKTALVPYLLSALLYLVLSFAFPMSGVNNGLAEEIVKNYRLSPLLLLPALMVLVLPLFRVPIRITMVLSMVCGVGIAVFYQGEGLLPMLRALLFGYEPDFTGLFAQGIAGGGLSSMVLSALVVILASTFAGIFERTGILKGLEQRLILLSEKTNFFTAVLVSGLAVAAVAANQTLSIILTGQMLRPVTGALKKPPEEQALHMENTVVPLSGVIPWNVCCASQLSILGLGAGCVGLAFFPWLVALWNLGVEALKARTGPQDWGKQGASLPKKA